MSKLFYLMGRFVGRINNKFFELFSLGRLWKAYEQGYEDTQITIDYRDKPYINRYTAEELKDIYKQWSQS